MNEELLTKLHKKLYNKFTAEGTIIRGCVYLEKPGVKYTEVLQGKDQKEELRKLRALKNKLAVDLRIQRSMLEIDLKKGRIITSQKIVQRQKEALKKMRMVPAVVEELPEHDFLEVEIEFI